MIYICVRLTTTNIQINSNMQVSKKIINKWRSLREKGDINAIAELTKKEASTISRVLSGKQEATISLISAINTFYKNRKKEVAKIENDLN